MSLKKRGAGRKMDTNSYQNSSKLRLITPVIVFADALAILLSMAISFILRFDGLPLSGIYDIYVKKNILSLPIVIALYLAAFSVFRLYRYAWRFASLEMMWGIVYSCIAGIAGLIVAQRFIDGNTFPRAVIAMLFIFSFVSIAGLRIGYRMINCARRSRRISKLVDSPDQTRKHIVIAGCGSDGAHVLKSLQEDVTSKSNVIGFLDDDPERWGVYVGNVKVLGSIDLLDQLLDNGVDEVVIALPQASNERIRECMLQCRQHNVPAKVMPEFRDVFDGKAAMQLVDFSVEDLLRREPANTDVTDMGSYVTGKRVLVTGAGGSIGSELCRQIASLNPESLVLLGHGENSIHNIYQELQSSYPHLKEHLSYAIASVSHEPRINQIFDSYRPEIVFHAAAHKHVPIMETNEQEAVFNNVSGTHNIANACSRFGAKRMILISTDKAAHPSSIMGATKLLCEEILLAMAAVSPNTSYITVRFGNVLGSRGSVVPAFREQIMNGGPVTVTHPDMSRYFMTIPEAVRLVLQAGEVGKSGELYLLDMGDPVKIVDLAKDMILLHGFAPGVDMDIQFTGVRPGEKIYERLASDHERIEKSKWDGLLHVHRPERCTPSDVFDAVERLEHAANYGTALEVRQILDETIYGLHESVKVSFGDQCQRAA